MAILTDAFSYARRCVSYCLISYCSFPKFFVRDSCQFRFTDRVTVRTDLYSFVIK